MYSFITISFDLIVANTDENLIINQLNDLNYRKYINYRIHIKKISKYHINTNAFDQRIFTYIG